MLFLGTCRMLSHASLLEPQHHLSLDLDFSPHAHLPSAVPILPATFPPGTHQKLLSQRLHHSMHMVYTDMYDGLLILNTKPGGGIPANRKDAVPDVRPCSPRAFAIPRSSS